MRFRHGPAERAAAVIWLMACLALATARWWLLPVLILPLLAVIASFRRGTDVDSEGVTVRAAVASRRISWSDIADLRREGTRRVLLVRQDGGTIPLPAVRPADLTKLIQPAHEAPTPGWQDVS